MTTNEEIAYIRQKLSEPEILCALAEEAAELAQAALKLRRALDGTNPTPKAEGACYYDLLEEIADVDLCIKALGLADEQGAVITIEDIKAPRWVARLSERGKHDHATD